MTENVDEILQRSLEGNEISRSECLRLMEIKDYSPEMYNLFFAANKLSRDLFKGRGEVHAQIGIDYSTCPRKCDFCVFGGTLLERLELDEEEVVERAKKFERAGADAIYLMTTAAFDFDKFINIGKAVRATISPKTPLVANIDDFGSLEAQELGNAGFSAIYHSVRLREGEDTRIDPKTRIATVQYAKRAGLKIFFCVEPVGPEHSDEEIVELIFLGKELDVTFSGAMRRTSTRGTALEKHGEISWVQLAKIVAITRLVMGDSVVAHCTHEPNLPSLLGGANLIWAETGPNPRDACTDTSGTGGRGLSIEDCRRFLWEAGLKSRFNHA